MGGSHLLLLNMYCLAVLLMSSLVSSRTWHPYMPTTTTRPPTTPPPTQPPYIPPPTQAPYAPPPPADDGYGDVPVVMYNPDMEPNDNGYSNERPEYCHMEDKIVYVDRCEQYNEETCYTQNRQSCQDVEYRNCTGVVESKVHPVCFNVNELLCDLEERVNYDIDVDQKDDFQCADIESLICEDKEVEIKDVT